jgi:hypothetical protein
MVKWSVALLFIFIPLSLSTFAKSGVKDFLKISRSMPHAQEQITLVVYDQKIELSLNSNAWTEKKAIGLFEITNKKDVSKLKRTVGHFLRNNNSGNHKNYPKGQHHRSVLSVNSNYFTEDSGEYQLFTDFIFTIFKQYRWRSVDEITFKKGQFHSSSKGKMKGPAKCKKKSGKLLCQGKFGVIYL